MAAVAMMAERESKQTASRSAGSIEVLIRSSAVPAEEADRRFADFLHQLVSYRRADEAAGHRFTGADGQPLPPLPMLEGSAATYAC